MARGLKRVRSSRFNGGRKKFRKLRHEASVHSETGSVGVPSPPPPPFDMNEMPRQQTFKDEQDEVSQNITVNKNDVHSLLSFANFVQKADSIGATLERRTVLSARDEPRAYAGTRHPWRLAKCLDSLANVCVSEVRGEVLATALRYGKVDNQATLEIFIAGNADVSERTLDHLRCVWDLLRRISATLHRSTGHQHDDNSPTHVKDLNALALIREFETTVLKFTYSRIQQKLFKKIGMFSSQSPTDGLEEIKEIVFWLDDILRQDQPGGKTSKPLSAITTDNWVNVRALLKFLSKKVSEHYPKVEEVVPTPFIRYLHKIGGIGADLKQLSSAACSPRHIGVFSITPNIIALKEMQQPVSSFPASTETWQDQMKRSLSYFNTNPKHSEKKRLNDTFQKHCIGIGEKHNHATRYLPVHCEVKLALHLFMEERDPKQRKPASYPYIGVSKLSCTGCSTFLAAFNEVHDTKFLTEGQHGKAYFPWGFPEVCPKARDVLEKQYEKLNNWFVPWYYGFSGALPGPDSTGQSNPSGSTPVDDPEEAEALRKFFGHKRRKVEE